MEVELILNKLEKESHSFYNFVRSVYDNVKHYPVSMRLDPKMIQYINESPWFDDGLAVVQRFNDLPPSVVTNDWKDHICRTTFSYLGTVIDREEFWISLISSHPKMFKYYCFESSLLKSLVGIMS